ncbi:MAG: phosphoglycerate kinase [Candidatus Shapirobacteria bacterium]
MKYLSQADFSFKDKRVLLRVDADVDLKKKGKKWTVDEDYRLICSLAAIRFLQEKQASQIVLLGHLGRPGGKIIPDLSLRPVADWYQKKLGNCFFISDQNIGKIQKDKEEKIILLENLRFFPGEEKNDPGFVQKLARWGDVFVNEAFGNSHRQQASIIGLPKILPSFLGLRVEGEVKTLTWLKKYAPQPIVFILGGSKEDKLNHLNFLASWPDYLLIGGKFPLLIKDKQKEKKKIIVAKIKKNGKDLQKESINNFKKIIKMAKTITWAGPMGVYEEKENAKGTKEIGQAIGQSTAFKIAGGGDTHRIISRLNLWSSFNFVSVGGGAMLEFLEKETLPGIALL